MSTSIRDASDFVELCALNGYQAEEHVVQTKDGYLLGLHRLAWRKGEEDQRVNSGPNSVQKRVVYLHHGLLMNSEVWVCQTDTNRSLAFVLVDQGFDVWVSFVCSTSVIVLPHFQLEDLTRGIYGSLETTAATSTRRRVSTIHRLPQPFGISPLTNLLSTTFRIVSRTSSRLRTKSRCRTLVSRKEQHRPLPVWPSIQDLTSKSTCLSPSRQPCHRRDFPTE